MKTGAFKNASSTTGEAKARLAFENPFLQRELRQLSRRPRSLQVTLLLCLGAMGAALLLWVASATSGGASMWGIPRHSWDLWMRWLLIVSHTLLCVIVAIYGGNRLFVAEQLRSTFELTQLLPYSPLRWLLLKLAFPALGVAIAWFAGVPFYLLAWVCNLIPLEALPQVMHTPLLGSLGMMILSLFVTPDYYRRYQMQLEKQKLSLNKRKDNDPEMGVWSLLLWFGGMTLTLGLFFGQGLTTAPRIFYGAWVPEAFYWLAISIVIVPAAFLTSTSALINHERILRLAHRVRFGVLLFCYYLLGGLVWTSLPFWYQLAFLLTPFVMSALTMISLRGKNPKNELPTNPASEREVQWITSRYPNALLLRDLRVYSRRVSIKHSFCWTLAIVLLSPVALWALITYGGVLFSTRGLWRVVVQMAIQPLFMYVPMTWGRPAMLWQKERLAKTLPLLLLTPLTSREILWGRWLAAPVYYGVAQSPLLLVLLAGIIWATIKGYWIAGPFALAVLPLVFSMGVWMCCNPGGTRTQALYKPLGLMVGVAQLVWLAATGVFGVLGMMACLSTFPSGSYVNSAPVAWILACVLALGHAALGYAWFLFKVKQLDEFRQGDMEVPDSKELAPQRSPWKFARIARAKNAT